ncbi:MAG: BC1872 family protein [Chloroflexota bacterium]
MSSGSGRDSTTAAPMASVGAGGSTTRLAESARPDPGRDRNGRDDGVSGPASSAASAAEAPRAGRELDAVVGERVFGWTVQTYSNQPYQVDTTWQRGTAWTRRAIVPAFSTDAGAALQVVERLADPGRRRGVEIVRDSDGRWHARFVRRGRASPRFTAAATLPLAICVAALEAVDAFGDSDAGEPGTGNPDAGNE